MNNKIIILMLENVKDEVMGFSSRIEEEKEITNHKILSNILISNTLSKINKIIDKINLYKDE